MPDILFESINRCPPVLQVFQDLDEYQNTALLLSSGMRVLSKRNLHGRVDLCLFAIALTAIFGGYDTSKWHASLVTSCLFCTLSFNPSLE